MKNLARRRKNPFRVIFYILSLVTIFYMIFNFFVSGGQKGVVLSDKKEPEYNSLREVVEHAMEGTKGTYAISIKNLKTGEIYNLNEHREYDAGSLYKLWVMATIYKKIEKGDLDEEKVLSEKVETLNGKFGIDENTAELTDGEVTLTTSQALGQMVTISHNYAALLLTEEVGLSRVKSWMEENGFSESMVGVNGESPVTSASDMVTFLDKLYIGELASKEYTDKMINLLKDQRLNDKLPKFLPEKVEVAHKTGEIGYFSHDAGIVYTDKGDYIIVVLSESDFPSGAEERIAQLSKAVYDYFQRR